MRGKPALHRPSKAPRRQCLAGQDHQRLKIRELNEQEMPVIDHSVDARVVG